MKDLCSPKHISRLLHPLLLLLATAALFATSCAKKEKEAPDPALPRLEAIEAIVDDYPDSAATSLHAISPDTLRTPASRALYYLLATTDHIKNRNIFPSDSLIQESVDFYSSTHQYPRLVQALLYKGRYLYSQKEYSAAMITAIEGLNESEHISDLKAKGKLHDLIADIYFELKDIPGELEHRKITLDLYKEAKENIYYDYALLSYANSLLNNKKYNEVCDFIETHKTTTFPPLCDISVELNDIYGIGKYYSGHQMEGIQIIHKNICDENNRGSALSYSILANNALTLNQPDSSLYWLNRINVEFPNNKLSYFSGKYAYYLYCKDFKGALSRNDSILSTQNRQLDEMLSNQLSEALSKYYIEKQDLLSSIHRRDKLVMFISSLFVLSIIICVLFIFRQRTIRIRTQRDNLMTEVHNILDMAESEKKANRQLIAQIQQNEYSLKSAQSEIEYQKNELSHVSGLANSLFRQKFNVLNRLCVDYFEHEEEDIARVAIYNQLKNEIAIISSPRYLKNLTDEINTYSNHLLDYLHKKFPSLKETDYTFIVLHLAGFKARTICLVINITLSNFYAKRKRLKDKFLNSDADRKQELIEIFSKE